VNFVVAASKISIPVSSALGQSSSGARRSRESIGAVCVVGGVGISPVVAVHGLFLLSLVGFSACPLLAVTPFSNAGP